MYQLSRGTWSYKFSQENVAALVYIGHSAYVKLPLTLTNYTDL